jgi:hypothetical protein
VRSKFSKPDTSFWIFTASVLILLTVPKLVRDGMFLDGMLYTSVAHNLGNGTGTFWQPVFSPFWSNAGSGFFHEHPPLALGIQALFFKVLGDSMYVERFYIFLTMTITAFLIAAVWRIIFRGNESIRGMAWLPVLLWFLIPTVPWSYSNNMMENTMGLFALAGVLFSLRGCEKEKNSFVSFALSGLFIFMATMSKGVPGFFPIAVPFIYWLIFRKGNFYRPVLQTLIVVLVPAIAYFILFRIPESRESLMFYVKARLLQRIDESPTVTNRLYVFGRVFSELAPLLALTAIAFILLRLKRNELMKKINFRYAAFFFLAGLAASAPLAMTMVQRGFYLVPSFPYFAIAFSVLFAPAAFETRNKILSGTKSLAILKYSGFALIIVALILSIILRSEPVRDKKVLHDVHLIGHAIPGRSAITVSDGLYGANYSLECYFIRYYNIALHINEPEKYLLALKEGEKPDTTVFSRVKLDTRVYDLYEKR